MLPTADVILDIVEPLLADWPEGTIWLQMSSVGAAEADQLTQAARVFGRLGATTFQRANVPGVAVPGGDCDALIEQPTGHGGTHQPDAQQFDTHLVLIGPAS
jgi:hypothetical protein